MSVQSDTSKCSGKVMAIRRETMTVWERRTAVLPKHVKALCEKGVKVIVQPCNKRIFTNEEYKDAGAEIKEDISEASVIIGIKDVPLDQLTPDKTFCFYSHVNKGVEESMPTLRTCLPRRIRLIDYEELKDGEGKMVPNVVFSEFAGIAGVVDILNGLGLRLLSLGFNTPFLNIGLAHNYRRKSLALQAIREAGYEIAVGNMPESIGPIIFAILGIGSCSKGVRQVLEEFPHQYIEVEDLPQVSENGCLNKVYLVIVNTKDYLRRKEGDGFDREEYRTHPDRYKSLLARDVAPYAMMIINCLNWDHTCPVLMTNDEARDLVTSSKDSNCGHKLPHRPVAICDAGAEHGAFEFAPAYTSLDIPFFMYDAVKQESHHDFTGPGLLVCTIDNMPTQFPFETSTKFADAFFPYIENIIASDATRPLEEQSFHPAVRKAVIASNGELTPEFKYLDKYL